MRFNPMSDSIESCVCISNDRFAELVRKEELLRVVERILANNEYCTVTELKVILGVKKENTNETV